MGGANVPESERAAAGESSPTGEHQGEHAAARGPDGAEADKGATESALIRFGAPLLVLLLCALSVAAKVHVNEPRTGVAHGDAGYYLTVAKNLTEGRGFVTDYVADFMAGPKRLPCPANTFWMPLTPVILAAGMLLFGTTFAAAKGTMIAVSSLAPLLAYLLGRELFGGRRHGLAAALLAATSEGYLTAACQPQTHGVTLVLGSAWLLLALRAMRDPAGWKWMGPMTALLHLNRSDGAFYFLVLGLLWLLPLPGMARFGWRTWRTILVGYGLVMAPLWVHNVFTLGTPMPLGLGRAALMTEYSQTYSTPESLTLESFFDAGWDVVYESKRKAVETNGATFLLGAATGNQRAETRLLRAHHFALLGLVWLGWPLLVRRRFLPILGALAILWSIYTFVFSATGLASLRSSVYPIYLAYFAAAGRVLDLAVGWLATRVGDGRLVRRVGTVGATLFLGWIGWSQVSYAAEETRQRVRFIHMVERKHEQLVRQIVEPFDLHDAVIMTWDVHELHVHTGLKLVMVPHEPEPTIYRIARELGVTHVLIFGAVEQVADLRPGLAAIPSTREHYEILYRDLLLGERVRLFRVLP